MFQFFVEGAFLTLLSGGCRIAGAAALMAALGTLPSAQVSIRQNSWPARRARILRLALREYLPDSIRRGVRLCLSR